MRQGSLESSSSPLALRDRGRTRQVSPAGARAAAAATGATTSRLARLPTASEDNGHGGGASFHIIVAARIRPFNKKELKRWRKEKGKQLGASFPQVAAAAADQQQQGSPTLGDVNASVLANTHAVRTALHKQRHDQRRPLGPNALPAAKTNGAGGLLPLNSSSEIDAALLATLSETNPEMAEALRQAQPHFFGGGGGAAAGARAGSPSSPAAAALLAGTPLPTMDVEPDGRTIMLLDPANSAVARGAFTFDYVFSSFAPTVELTLPGKGTREPRARNSGSSSMVDASHVNMSTAILGEDNVLSPQQEEQAEQEQQRIFELLGAPLLESALNGFNACIFAYGQTSSGKTYTMLGTKRHWGITPRLLHALFAHFDAESGSGHPCEGGGNENAADAPDFTSGSPLSLPALRGGASPRVVQNRAGGSGSSGRGSAGSPRSSSQKLSPRARQQQQGSAKRLSGSSLSSAQGPGSRLQSGGNASVYVDVAYMEIYNEQVRDLLKQRPKNAILHYSSRFDSKDVDHSEYQALKVRQHPEHGLFVEGLTSVRVSSWAECERFLKQGNQLRTQAATSMNATSSRSHAIFQLMITRVEGLGGRVRGQEVTSKRVSKVNLVDLAGSERNSVSAASSKGVKSHVQEANNINVSLSTLRRVIDALVINSQLPSGATSAPGAGNTKAPVVVPYRESLLTYVLSDNFGGNSRTVMCANVSPSEYNLNETESTLRYATLARGVRNRVKVNEDPSARVIHELQSRIHALQGELAMAPSPHHVAELELDLEENAAALAELQVKHERIAQALTDKAEREVELLEEIKRHHELELRLRQDAQKEREARRHLETVVQQLRREKESFRVAAAAADGEANQHRTDSTTASCARSPPPALDEAAVGQGYTSTAPARAGGPVTPASSPATKERRTGSTALEPSPMSHSDLSGAPGHGRGRGPKRPSLGKGKARGDGPRRLSLSAAGSPPAGAVRRVPSHPKSKRRLSSSHSYVEAASTAADAAVAAAAANENPADDVAAAAAADPPVYGSLPNGKRRRLAGKKPSVAGVAHTPRTPATSGGVGARAGKRESSESPRMKRVPSVSRRTSPGGGTGKAAAGRRRSSVEATPSPSTSEAGLAKARQRSPSKGAPLTSPRSAAAREGSQNAPRPPLSSSPTTRRRGEGELSEGLTPKPPSEAAVGKSRSRPQHQNAATSKPLAEEGGGSPSPLALIKSRAKPPPLTAATPTAAPLQQQQQMASLAALVLPAPSPQPSLREKDEAEDLINHTSGWLTESRLNNGSEDEPNNARHDDAGSQASGESRGADGRSSEPVSVVPIDAHASAQVVNNDDSRDGKHPKKPQMGRDTKGHDNASASNAHVGLTDGRRDEPDDDADSDAEAQEAAVVAALGAMAAAVREPLRQPADPKLGGRAAAAGGRTKTGGPTTTAVASSPMHPSPPASPPHNAIFDSDCGPAAATTQTFYTESYLTHSSLDISA